MKTLMALILAGGILAGSGFAQTSDHGANERFRMKTGRDLPSVEMARKSAARSETAATCCGMMACSMSTTAKRAAIAVVAHTDAEQRLHTKTGRYSPAEEVRMQAVRANDRQIAGLTLSHSDAEQRFHTKTGRYSQQEDARAQGGLMLTAADSCLGMGCCKRRS